MKQLVVLVQIPQEVLRLIIKSGNVVLIGTVNSKHIPNISPRFVLDVLNNEKLLFADAFQTKTFDNLKTNSKVTAAIIDKETMGGFQLKGEASEIEDENLIKQTLNKLRDYGFDTKLHRVWILKVDEVFSSKPSNKSKHPLISAYG